MDDREELQALRRLAELEAKAGTVASPTPSRPQQPTPRQAPGREELPSIGDYWKQRMLSGGVSLLQGATAGPMGIGAAGTGEALKTISDLMDRGAYKTGGAVTDALAPHVPPEVAGGAGYATNVGVQSIPVILGTLAGRAADPAIKAPFKWAGKKIRNIADPWLKGGVDRAVGRTAVEAAGPQRQAIIEALKQNKQIVPGSMPTAGEAAAPVGRAEFSGLQNVISGHDPSAYFARAGQQEAARAAALRQIGKTPADITAAESTRAAITGPMREAALERTKDVGVSTQKLIRQIRGVVSQPGVRASDVVRKTFADINQKIRHFTNRDGFINAKDLYTIRKELGNTIQKNAKETANWDRRFTAGLERDLQRNIDDAIEAAGGVGWKDYLNTYRDMSLPINRMQVGQELEKSLTTALGSTEKPASFATALRNAPQTLKRATGQPRYDTLEEILEPSQVKAVGNVLEDLKRTALHEQLAKAGTGKARDLLGQISPALPQAGMFNPKYSVARAISNRLAGRVEGKSIDRLAEAMQAPELMARLMQAASPSERAALAQALVGQRALGGTLGGTVGAGFGYESGRSP